MNYIPLTEVTEAGLFKLFAMTFDSAEGIFAFILGSVLLFFIGGFSKDFFAQRSYIAGSLILIASFVVGSVFATIGIAAGYSNNLEKTSIQNINQKYETPELINFEREISAPGYIFNGDYFDPENNITAQLSINVDKETGEPKIMQNAEVNEEFISSLERTK
jgi:hypothetical protein